MTELARTRLQIGLTVVCGVFGALSFFVWQPYTAYIAIAAGGWFAISAAMRSIRAKELDVNVLMVLAAIGAIAVGHPDDAAVLLFLFSLSGTLEHLTLSKTESAIEGLMKLRPDRAVRVLPSGDETVPLEHLEKGDRVRVAAFENIPVDGTILQGSSTVNTAAMTGESAPESITVGSAVLGGTQNLEGMFVMEVTAPAQDSALEKIVALVRDAQENKASGERISQWFGERYTFGVIGAFLLSLVVRLALHQPFPEAIYASIVLLVALSPCALVISTPATTLSALAWSAKNGILVRGGHYLEQLGRVNCAVLDKTGTLTAGKPRLIEICVCVPTTAGAGLCVEENSCWHGGPEMTPLAAKMLRAAAAAEQYSSHPIAEAVVAVARERGVDVPESLEQRDEPGLGVTARIDEGVVKIGQRRYFPDLPGDFIEHLEAIQSSGMTVAVLEFDGKYAALGLRDEPRKEAADFLDKMRRLGIEDMQVLTGDTKHTAEAVAAELGLEHVQAGLLPADKEAVIDSMEKGGKVVMMVGDGINDAPSLTRASVGVAMGGLGSDIALSAADVVLMQDRLSRIPEVVQLGRRTNRIIRTNLIFASAVILSLVAASFFWVLPLPIAVVGHEGSTVLVILNGLRLLRGPGRLP